MKPQWKETKSYNTRWVDGVRGGDQSSLTPGLIGRVAGSNTLRTILNEENFAFSIEQWLS